MKTFRSYENELNMDLEKTILRKLLTDDSYMRKVLPFIKSEYFNGIYKISLFELWFAQG